MSKRQTARAYRQWFSTLSPDALRALGKATKARRAKGKAIPGARLHSAPIDFITRLAVWRPDANPERYWWWAREVRRLSGYRCRDCGATRVELHAHHVYGWAENVRHRYDPRNGAALCRPCHERIHGRTFRDQPKDAARNVRALTAPIKAKYGFR